MFIILLLAAAYGSSHMSFPWWVWVIAAIWGSRDVVVTIKQVKED